MKRDKVTEAYELGRKHEREMLVECLNKTRVEAIKDYDDYCIDGFLRDFKQSIVDFPLCVDCGVKVERHEAQCTNCRIQL
jgi:hypothetical protein